jgi:hypothetical protein
MSEMTRLAALEYRGAYPGGIKVLRRWGEILRSTPEIASLLKRCVANETLVPLASVAQIRGGVVPRANAYFLVRELEFAEIPHRFNLTRRDWLRIAVVMDGKETPHRIEREFLRPAVKGPESLLSAIATDSSTLRIFIVNEDKASLRARHMSGALAYLHRGETVSYNVSEDSLKGGIPALRANIKSRRPHWYSLSIADYEHPRIVVPEHLDQRYMATLLPAGSNSVVLDKLYNITPLKQEATGVIHMSLNSLLTWYQIELRGRTQLGQGVLELKVPDWAGLLVLNPDKLSKKQVSSLQTAFEPIADIRQTGSIASLADASRLRFDRAVLACAGMEPIDDARLILERALRDAAGERYERRESVAEAKIERRTLVRASASVDAYAARIAAGTEPYPDPRNFALEDTPSWTIPITGTVDGPLTLGNDLFNQGQVYSGSNSIAQTSDSLSAQFVKVVLLHDPALSLINVPKEPQIREIMTRWRESVTEWRRNFRRAHDDATRGIDDDRLRASIEQSALGMLHAE